MEGKQSLFLGELNHWGLEELGHICSPHRLVCFLRGFVFDVGVLLGLSDYAPLTALPA